MFRPSDQQVLPQIYINRDNIECINAINIDTNNLQTSDNNYIVTDESKILDILGCHFEKINAKKN